MIADQDECKVVRDTHCVTMVDIVPEEQCEVRNNWFFAPVSTVQ